MPARRNAEPPLAVSLPCGRPTPSGATVMLHDSTSSGVAGRPNCALSCASATPDAPINAATRRYLRIYMAHLPARADRPAGDAIGHVVSGQAALGNHGGARPLHVAGVVGAAA